MFFSNYLTLIDDTILIRKFSYGIFFITIKMNIKREIGQNMIKDNIKTIYPYIQHD